jgi:peptide-methionine (S)-S-oxide reductase
MIGPRTTLRALIPASALAALGAIAVLVTACQPHEPALPAERSAMREKSSSPGLGSGGGAAPSDEPAAAQAKPSTEVVTLGAGCFWCIEAVLEQIEGVTDVRSGYMGGEIERPSYEQVCSGTTGHAEVVEVSFDPAKLSFEKLLEHFWELHDPTTLNRQGNDFGTQYRSAIFYHSEAQRVAAEKSKAAKDASGELRRKIVTEIAPASKFWVAENYHQDYYRLNKRQPYCSAVIRPKLEKLGLEP